jgi:triphosphoribosyl-dephospho-CoA synthase
MMHATGDFNTHRGAIWAMGLLVTAAACDPASTAPAAVAARAGALARLDDRAAPSVTRNKGELACRRYGVGGARGQAAADFPHVIDVALPELRRSRVPATEDAARLNALLSVMSRLDDTCVLSRGGEAALHVCKRAPSGCSPWAASAVLAAGAPCRLSMNDCWRFMFLQAGPPISSPQRCSSTSSSPNVVPN